MDSAPATGSWLSRLVIRQSKAVLFLTLCLCVAGALSAWSMPSSVFPQTNFPRVVVLVDNGVMPADQMMAAITRPIEEAMKDIPGVASVRTATGRGSAEVNVFFNWSVDMQQAELHVHSRLSQIRSTLPASASTSVFRLTFSAFPIIGLSLTSVGGRSQSAMWETARYTIKPRLLRIPGIARVDLVGGRVPEYHVRVDPVRLEGYKLALTQVADALMKNNLISAAGLHDEDRQLYLTILDARVKTAADISQVVVAQSESGPIRIKDFAEVVSGQEPQFNIVTADGKRAVLLNVRSQPDGNTAAIADSIEKELALLRSELPPDLRMAFFYDQSLLVRESVGSVWESILFGLLLSVAILVGFLKSGNTWGTTLSTTLIAVTVIPVTVLAALVAMKLLGMSFNLMTLGGIAAAIGLVIDDAIVVVESIATHVAMGKTPAEAVGQAALEVTGPLVGSTLTPVVVFIPLAFIDGIQGVFFRALAVTMVVSLLTSLLLAVTLTPTLAARFIRGRSPARAVSGQPPTGPRSRRFLWFFRRAIPTSIATPDANANGTHEQGGFIMRRLIRLYEWSAWLSLRFAWLTLLLTFGVLGGAAALYFSLKQDFLPDMDEGAFVIDYRMPPGTALSETDRALRHFEEIIRSTPEVEIYSRRTGARLALAISEPHKGDFLVKLKPERRRGVKEVKDELRDKIHQAEPALKVEMPGILGDLIGDLTWSPAPIEIKVFSTDVATLKKQAAQIAESIEFKDGKGVPGVVDVEDGLVFTGSSQVFRVRPQELLRYGIKADDAARTLGIALLGETPSAVLEGDRQINIRLLVDPRFVQSASAIEALSVRSEQGGPGTPLGAVSDRVIEAGQLELRREDLRQNVAVSARTSGRDLGSVIRDIQAKLDKELPDRTGFTLEFGGLYQQQQESFRNLTLVLVFAVLLVFLVLLVEFRTLLAPLAIIWGALLSLSGVGLALWLTNTSLNMAYGIGSGAQMLQPLAIAVMGALAISVLLSLLATPVVYFLLMHGFGALRANEST